MKNTTLRFFSELICPHYCFVCGRMGQILCDCCKKNFLAEAQHNCLGCGVPIVDKCANCALPFERQWMLGAWNEGWREMVEEYKYKSVMAYGLEFAELLDAWLPLDLGTNVVVMPLPTIKRHVRSRGMDHTLLIAKHLARMRGWSVSRSLVRATDTVQVGSDRETRRKQARKAYKIGGNLDLGANYLLLDDVWTTGSSLCAAAKILFASGVKNIDVVVLTKSGKQS